jgi:Protein of unknown function VcgC/VcgE (DUF2780)
MADFLTELASRAGLEGDQAHQGVGALLAMLKSRLDPAAFAHVQNAIPNSDQMLAGYEDKKQWASGGLLDAVKGVAGKMFGGGGDEQEPGTSLEGHFARIGLTQDHIQSLLPKLHDMLAGRLPPGVLDQIKQHVPSFRPVEEEVQQE